MSYVLRASFICASVIYVFCAAAHSIIYVWHAIGDHFWSSLWFSNKHHYFSVMCFIHWMKWRLAGRVPHWMKSLNEVSHLAGRDPPAFIQLHSHGGHDPLARNIRDVAVCCSALQCVAVWCSVLQCVAVCCSTLQCVAVCCSVSHGDAVCCSVLQCVVVCCRNIWSGYG